MVGSPDMEYVSFKLEAPKKEQLEQISEGLGQNRSDVLREAVTLALPILAARMRIVQDQRRHSAELAAQQIAKAVKEGRIAPLPSDVAADADMVAEVEEGA